jgi:hypothetical protein
MHEVLTIILYTLCAGACVPSGGLLAYKEKIRPEWLENEFRHFVIALGGGILIAAVALVLVPQGVEYVNYPILSVFILLTGGVCFFVIERFLGARRRETAIYSNASGLFSRIPGPGRSLRGRLPICTIAGSIYRPTEFAGGF